MQKITNVFFLLIIVLITAQDLIAQKRTAVELPCKQDALDYPLQ